MSRKKMISFGGSFNPPGLHHLKAVMELKKYCDEVIVIICGPRPDKEVTNDIEAYHRGVMCGMTFRGIPGVRVEYFDLENGTFTRNDELDAMFQNQGDFWHGVGADIVKGGKDKKSDIHTIPWQNHEWVWDNLKFCLLKRPGYDLDPADYPPNNMVIDLDIPGSSTDIRHAIREHKDFSHMVTPEVYRYIKRHDLYLGKPPKQNVRFQLDEEPRLLLIADSWNERAVALAQGLEDLSCPDNPNMAVIFGGDGTMFRGVKEVWPRRIPILGIGMGNRCYSLNRLEDIVGGFNEDFFKREFRLHQIRMLRVGAVDYEGNCQETLAVNDAYVIVDRGKMGLLDIAVDDEVVLPQAEGDGALVATWLGSTAYAMSMGAKPLTPGERKLLVVGNNLSRPLFWKYATHGIDSVIKLCNLDSTMPKRKPLHGFADSEDLGEVQELVVRSSNVASAELLFVDETDLVRKHNSLQYPKELMVVSKEEK